MNRTKLILAAMLPLAMIACGGGGGGGGGGSANSPVETSPLLLTIAQGSGYAGTASFNVRCLARHSCQIMSFTVVAHGLHPRGARISVTVCGAFGYLDADSTADETIGVIPASPATEAGGSMCSIVVQASIDAAGSIELQNLIVQADGVQVVPEQVL